MVAPIASGRTVEQLADLLPMRDLVLGDAQRKQLDELGLTRAYVKLGEVFGLDWAQGQVTSFRPSDQWERLLVAGLARDFEQLRIDWMSRLQGDPETAVERWTHQHQDRIEQFRKLVARARVSGEVTVPMLAQVAQQARILLSR